jgi:hypothetical protein
MEGISSGVLRTIMEIQIHTRSKTGRLVCTIGKPGTCMLGERLLAIRHLQYKESEGISDCIIVRISCQNMQVLCAMESKLGAVAACAE